MLRYSLRKVRMRKIWILWLDDGTHTRRRGVMEPRAAARPSAPGTSSRTRPPLGSASPSEERAAQAAPIHAAEKRGPPYARMPDIQGVAVHPARRDPADRNENAGDRIE